MSSSELQRIALATSRVVQPTGVVPVEPLENEESVLEENDAENNKETYACDEVVNTYEIKNPSGISICTRPAEENVGRNSVQQVNGVNISNSPNQANETISSSIGDITVDSVRDHLNMTTTTLCSINTEETIGE